MIPGDIFYDVSEFVAGPSRTGIQRVVYEVLRSWQFDQPLAPGFIDRSTGRAALLPADFPELMREYFAGDSKRWRPADERILAAVRKAARPLDERDLAQFSRFLNLEAFHEPARVAFYRDLARRFADRMHWLVHDLLAFLRPEFFPPRAAEELAPYLELLRALPSLHFTSDAGKGDFCAHFAERDLPTYRVSPLGADSFGRAAPAFSPRRRRFTYVGTIEPRKNHDVVLGAFEALWARGADIELAFVGRLGWNTREAGWKPFEIGDQLAALADRNPRFSWHRDLDDRKVRDLIASSRATLYVSAAEGFGLPPLESLALGVPVIASAGLPSLGAIAELGQIRLPDISVDAVTAAVAAMMDDTTAALKFREIAGLSLPTWRGFAQSLRDAMSLPGAGARSPP